MTIGRPPRPLAERFWERVDKTSSSNGCWLWIGSKFSSGYGSIGAGGGKDRGGYTLHANRLSWEIHNGPIPEGMCVLHHCDNPSCVNPTHLFLGTKADNNRDRTAKGRSAKGEHHGTHTKPETVVHGEKHYSAKLTSEQVSEIRTIYDANQLSQRELANRYGVSQRAILKILQRRMWKDV